MLKDLKDVDPDYETNRLLLLPAESISVDGQLKSTEAAKHSQKNEEEDGDVRFLEKEYNTVEVSEKDSDTKSVQKVEASASSKPKLEQSDDNEKAFNEYLEVSRINLEEELQTANKNKDQALSEHTHEQTSDKDGSQGSSDSHGSVLEAIEHAVSIYSDEKHAKKKKRAPKDRRAQSLELGILDQESPSVEEGANKMQTDAAILNEILSTRKKKMLDGGKRSKIVGFHTGSFKI